MRMQMHRNYFRFFKKKIGMPVLVLFYIILFSFSFIVHAQQFKQEETAKIITAFPMSVRGEWANRESIARIDVGSDEQDQEFTKNNSAYPEQYETETELVVVPDVQEPVQGPQNVTTDNASDSPEAVKVIPKKKIKKIETPEIVTPALETDQKDQSTSSTSLVEPIVEPVPKTTDTIESSPKIPIIIPDISTVSDTSQVSEIPIVPTLINQSSFFYDLIQPILQFFIPQFALAESNGGEKNSEAIIQDLPEKFSVSTDTTKNVSSAQNEEKPLSESSLFSNVAESIEKMKVEKSTKKTSVNSFLVAADFAPAISSPVISEQTSLKNVELHVSLANSILENGNLFFTFLDQGEWKQLYQVPLTIERTWGNGNEMVIPLVDADTLNKIRLFQVKATFSNSEQVDMPVLIDAIWIRAEVKLTKTKTSADVIRMVSTKKDFKADEDMDFSFAYDNKSQKNFVQKMAGAVGLGSEETLDISQNTVVKIFAMDGKQDESIVPEITYNNTSIAVHIKNNNRFVKPGQYKIAVDVYDKNIVDATENTFTIGIVTVNTNKAVYAPGEQVYIQLGALDSDGNTLCDAHMEIIVTGPSKSLSEVMVQKSSDCSLYSVSNNPDYFGYYYPQTEGDYQIQVTNQDNGTVINSAFTVAQKSPIFIIERTAATRIYPLAAYEMNITITANINFIGTLTEIVPNGFAIDQVKFGSTSMQTVKPTMNNGGSEIEVQIPVTLVKGEIYHFSYRFDAPDLTPYVFLIGPLQFKYNHDFTVSESAKNNTATQEWLFGDFEEGHQWQLASDALATIEPNGDGTVQCTPTPTGTHYTTVDDHIFQPTTPTTTDYVSCSVNKGDNFAMGTTTNVASVSSVTVWLYENTKINNTFVGELWNSAHTTQYGTSQYFTHVTSAQWQSVTFSGLSLTQSQLDDLQVAVRNINQSSTSGGSVTAFYAMYATVTYTLDNQAPVVTSVSINNNSDINLSPLTTTAVSITATITDNKGYADIVSASAKLYRSGVSGAQSCSLNDDNCYAVSGCQLLNCSGNACTASCTVNVQYFADPTDAGTTWSTENWAAQITATDTLSQTGSALAATNVEMLTIRALSFDVSGVDFGALSPGVTVEQQNKKITITLEGNSKIDVNIKGVDFVKTGDPSKIFSINNLHFSDGSDATYASSTTTLADSGTTLPTAMNKKTQSTEKSTKNVYWSLLAPNGSPGSYSTTVTFTTSQSSLPW